LNEGRRINQRRSLLKGLFSIKITFFLSFYLGGANQDTTTIACHFYCSAGRSLKALFSIKITFFFSFSYLPWLLHPLQAQVLSSTQSLHFASSSAQVSLLVLSISHTQNHHHCIREHIDLDILVVISFLLPFQTVLYAQGFLCFLYLKTVWHLPLFWKQVVNIDLHSSCWNFNL
jgi:hypothetical protein